MVNGESTNSKRPSRISIPLWVKHIPSLHHMYWNPVFQRRIIRNVLDFGITKKSGFIFGAVYVLILTMATFITPEVKMTLTLGLVSVGVLLILFRLIGSALVSTPKGMRNIMAEDMKDPVLTTPITNASIYYGVTLGTLMRGYMVIESMASMIIGIVFSYAAMVFIRLVLKSVWTLEVWLIPFKWLVSLAVISAGMFALGMLILLLFSFAAGYYATFLDTLTSVIMAVVHFMFMFGFGASLLYIPFILRDFSLMAQDEFVNGMLFGGLFMIGWIAMTVIGTAWMGVLSLARRRCPGFYEPDSISADEHVMRGM